MGRAIDEFLALAAPAVNAPKPPAPGGGGAPSGDADPSEGSAEAPSEMSNIEIVKEYRALTSAENPTPEQLARIKALSTEIRKRDAEGDWGSDSGSEETEED